jgi:hypothetical protein
MKYLLSRPRCEYPSFLAQFMGEVGDSFIHASLTEALEGPKEGVLEWGRALMATITTLERSRTSNILGVRKWKWHQKQASYFA